ncbi:electron transport complex subunit RsxC [Vibrio astriarenae]|uniref:Ion-translocating oxidoreductase complex subunit C n=1 Tax=Vibrio astriarenae TaxID=1481923 RepID=A0A7Z2T2H6_9VIBR|nr:electron transport complex subunit RsxC [Vibrio astriarenae]QIA63174.1 electron transport complex subunit RsxC [Vibrio astriarenae]
MINVDRYTSFWGRPFKGGVHPESHKGLTSGRSGRAPLVTPKVLHLSLLLPNGAILKPLVKAGDEVVRGQMVAIGTHRNQAPLHSPVNGKVESISPHISDHPGQLKIDAIHIKCFKDQTWGREFSSKPFNSLTSEEILQKIEDAGIIGLGGAGFSTAAKARFAKRANVQQLIINGGECEPYISCDDFVMRSHSNEVIEGVRLLLKATGAVEALIGIESNKPESFEAMTSAAADDENIHVQMVPTVYPMGSAHHLTKTLTGKCVSHGQRSTDIGVIVNNVSTARAVYQAVRYNRPLVSKILTVSGQGIDNPMNVEVPLGTTVRDIIAYCGGTTLECERLIFGGPMMGQVVTHLDVPINKTTAALLALTSHEIGSDQQQECIRCGQCVRACPMGLMPFQMKAAASASNYELAESLGINQCMSCGACSFICPSRVPLTEYFHHAKSVLSHNKQSKHRQEKAKALSEARKIRLEKEAELKRAAKEAKKAKRKRGRSRVSTNSEVVPS